MKAIAQHEIVKTLFVGRIPSAMVIALLAIAPVVSAQCTGTPAPSSSRTLIAQNNGTITAPGNGKQAYSTFPLDLSPYYANGGTLVIEARLGTGQSGASFDLFPDQASVPSTGVPDKALKVGAQPRQYDVTPGTCVTLKYPFSRLYRAVFGVTGNWLSPVGATNTFQFVAYVEAAGMNRPGSVSIFESPAMPNVGGHSVLAGLMHLSLTAILPNLRVCARPQNAPQQQRVCTEVCPPGHECMNQPFIGVVPHAAMLTVDAIDQDEPGSEHTFATFDVNPNTCNLQSPCVFNVPDQATYGQGAHVKIGFNIGSEFACTSDRSKHGPGRPVTFDGGRIINAQYADQVQVRAPLSVTGAAINGSSIFTLPVPGINVTVKDPQATFVQFFSRERIDASGAHLSGNAIQYSSTISYNAGDTVRSMGKLYTAVIDHTLNIRPDTSSTDENGMGPPGTHWQLKNDPGCDASPPGVSCYDLSTPAKSIWHWDGLAEYKPYYNPYDIVYGCGGSTLYDTPTMLLGSGPETWRFTGIDYVVVGQNVVWKVTWIKLRPANATQDQFSATVEPATANTVSELNNLLQTGIGR